MKVISNCLYEFYRAADVVVSAKKARLDPAFQRHFDPTFKTVKQELDKEQREVSPCILNINMQWYDLVLHLPQELTVGRSQCLNHLLNSISWVYWTFTHLLPAIMNHLVFLSHFCFLLCKNFMYRVLFVVYFFLYPFA